MHEATTNPTLTSDTAEDLTAAARRAESWFGEPFLQPDEEARRTIAAFLGNSAPQPPLPGSVYGSGCL